MMSQPFDYLLDRASETQIAEHLQTCDPDFIPPLSGRVDLADYAKKIANKATRFEAWYGGMLVGLVAAYCNDPAGQIVYITSVSVLKEWKGNGIAARLMGQCVEYARAAGMRQVCLEVASDNRPAVRLYEEGGFVAGKANSPFIRMTLCLGSDEVHEHQP